MRFPACPGTGGRRASAARSRWRRRDGDARTVDGACEGIIAFGPAGSNGFGYDPVFYFPEQGATMAQLDPEVKNRISHRGRAAQAAVGILAAMLQATASD